MVKVIWLLKRAEHLSLEEFRRSRLERHAPWLMELQRPYPVRYVVNIRGAETDLLPGSPAMECDRDGCAEQWFASEVDLGTVYGCSTPSPTRADTLAHVSRCERVIVREHVAIDPEPGRPA